MRITLPVRLPLKAQVVTPYQSWLNAALRTWPTAITTLMTSINMPSLALLHGSLSPETEAINPERMMPVHSACRDMHGPCVAVISAPSELAPSSGCLFLDALLSCLISRIH